MLPEEGKVKGLEGIFCEEQLRRFGLCSLGKKEAKEQPHCPLPLPEEGKWR